MSGEQLSKKSINFEIGVFIDLDTCEQGAAGGGCLATAWSLQDLRGYFFCLFCVYSPTAESFGVSAKLGPGALGQSSRKVPRGSELPSKDSK